MSQSSLPDHLIFHGNGGLYPPHGVITLDDHGPYVVITTWIMMCLMALSVLARLADRRSFVQDNIAVFASAVLAIGQSVAIHLAVNHGLGRHSANLSEKNYIAYSKAFYTSQLLKILVLWLAKVSLMLVFMRLTTSKQMRRVYVYFMAFLTLWVAASFVALALQCHGPEPWNLTSSRCFNQAALYYTTGILNIATDIVIVLLPALIIWNVQIKRKEKWAIFLIFATRLLVCITSVLELVSLGDYLSSSDQTWYNVVPNIWGQVMMQLSIITACIPLMKPFLTKLQFSLIDSSIPFSSNMYQLSSKDRSAWTRKS